MSDHKDIVDIDGFRDEGPGHGRGSDRKKTKESGRRFLSVLFRCCNTYGRLYPDPERTRYAGRCPKCGAQVEAGIGPGGTNRNIFDTH
ncbi:MAG: hypothetical protein CMJ33_01985 [Phycisphaerae bacterium]|nr:hypothetical protein [Phycisphaerae bacterium]HAW96239.1 hypothetical protein [Phycisphaerales bacterium]